MGGTLSFDYAGESAIVTGSTKGIGRGIARGLADAGADVVINARTASDVDATVAELDADAAGTVVGVPGDVGDPADIEHIVETAIEQVGPITILVNNAAMWPREASMIAASLDDWNDTIAVNVRSQFYASKLVAEQMIDADIAGSIINHTSQTGDRRCGGRGLYGTSKTAINGLTWRMAHDYAEHGIRVNAVSTDATDSYQLRYEAAQEAEETGRSVEAVLAEWGAERPLGRLGDPRDIANAVLYLASDQAEYVTGEILRVAGGGNLQ